jgi:hypothetical protein
MPKHDPPGDDAALLELERELMELDRAIRAADENREAINYALFDRRDELMARIFNTPAAGLAGLAVQARMRGLRRSTQRARHKGKIAQGAAIQMNHFLLNVEMSEWRSRYRARNTDHATSLCRTLAAATDPTSTQQHADLLGISKDELINAVQRVAM